MAELPPRYPLSPLTNEKIKRLTNPRQDRKEKQEGIRPLPPLPTPESASAPAPYRASSGRELPDFSSRQELNHHLVALFFGKQLRDLHMSASARFPACRFSHLLLQCLLLVSPPAAVAEQVFPGLDCAASAAAPPAFVVLSVADPF